MEKYNLSKKLGPDCPVHGKVEPRANIKIGTLMCHHHLACQLGMEIPSLVPGAPTHHNTNDRKSIKVGNWYLPNRRITHSGQSRLTRHQKL